MPPSTASDAKKDRILLAVRSVLARNGYAGTTVSQVAAEAGVSRGLIHYYFKSKEDMLAQLVRKNVEVSVTLAGAIFREGKTAGELAKQLCLALRNVMEADPDLFHLFFESWAMARQSPVIDHELKGLYAEFRGAIQNGLEHAASRGAIAPRLPLNGLAALLTSMIDGFGLQLMTEPDLISDPDMWEALETGIRLALGDPGS